MQKLHEIAMAAGGTFTPYGAGGWIHAPADYACKLEIDRQLRNAGREFECKPMGNGQWAWLIY
jgi:hypothetical protein